MGDGGAVAAGALSPAAGAAAARLVGCSGRARGRWRYGGDRRRPVTVPPARGGRRARRAAARKGAASLPPRYGEIPSMTPAADAARTTR